MGTIMDAAIERYADDHESAAALNTSLIRFLENRMTVMWNQPEVYARNPGEWQVQVMLIIDILCREVGLTRGARHAVMSLAKWSNGVPGSWEDAMGCWERGCLAIVERLVNPGDMEGA